MRNDTIWIGADSKIISKEGGPSLTPRCKIIKANNFVFVHAGLFGYGGYDIDSIFYYCYGIGRNYYNTRILFKDLTIKVLYQIASEKVTRDPQKFISGKKDTDYVSTVFATYETYKAKFISYVYKATIGKNDGGVYTITNVDSTIIESSLGATYTYLGGVYDAIILMRPNKNEDIPTFINNLIKIEIKAEPNKVGYPINKIRIAKDGIKWIQKKQP